MIKQFLFIKILSSLLLLQACSSDIQPNIDRLESVIASKGVVAHRLISMNEVPIDSYVEGVTTKTGTAETIGILKVLSDYNYLGSLEVIDEAFSQYPALLCKLTAAYE